VTDALDTKNFDSLDEFWDFVSPLSDTFSDMFSTYIFRGQSDSTWKLSPQVFREEVIHKYKTGMMDSMRDHPGQTFFGRSSITATATVYPYRETLPTSGISST